MSRVIQTPSPVSRRAPPPTPSRVAAPTRPPPRAAPRGTDETASVALAGLLRLRMLPPAVSAGTSGEDISGGGGAGGRFGVRVRIAPWVGGGGGRPVLVMVC